MSPVPLRAAFAGIALLVPLTCQAATFTFCLKWKLQTTDSGRTVTTSDGSSITEDHWATDKPQVQIAHGILFTVQRAGLNGGFPLLLWGRPDTGCADLTDADGTQTYLLRAYTVSVDDRGNTIRVVNPLGSPYVFDHVVQAKAGTTTTLPVPSNPFVPVSDNDKAVATLAAIAAFSAYRSTFGVSGKRLDIIEGTASSAHSGAGVILDQLERGYIRISIQTPTPKDDADHRRMKFIVSHEMGHAWLLLHHASGVEPSVILDYDASADDVCHYVTDSGGTNTYTMDSLEYNSVGFREGAAHFYAARVWNDPDKEGVISWFGGGGRSLARYTDPDLGGGRTFQACLTMKRPIETLCDDKVSTNEDWLRFWWAWHTQGGAPVSTTTIRDVYTRTWNNGGLTKDNYLTKLGIAVGQVVANANQTLAFLAFADWHGISSGENTRCQ